MKHPGVFAALHAQQRYTHEREIGSGGMASVRRVRDVVLLRSVAMKALHPALRASEVEVGRFIEEAQITGQLDHPNIVPVHEVGLDEQGGPYFTMKLVEGRTLAEEIAASQDEPADPIRLARLLEIFLKVCDALAFAHSRGVIHRDLKPQNVMVGSFGQVYVMDWGLARVRHLPAGAGASVEIRQRTDALAEEEVEGTVCYMAPEQAAATGEIDERTDVFALGAILYEILTGQPPYRGRDVRKLLADAIRCDIVPPQEVLPEAALPGGLCRIATKALSREPVARYQSVAELQRDVQGFLRGAGRFPKKTFAPGEVVIRQGDEAHEAYIIIRGRCEVFKDIDGQRMVLRRLGPGDVFGEAAVFSSKVRSASVVATQELTVRVVTRELISESFGLNTWMRSLVGALAHRFGELDRRLTRFEVQRSRLGQWLGRLFKM